ncbi:O-methyltransferase [Micrococcus luteus]|uniref:O-methyltransferase n=1 Tax=Micrococcus luteus TaxID=1270 RepID=UPI003635B4BC
MGQRSYLRSITGSRDSVLDQILRSAILDKGLPSIQVDDDEARILQLLTGLLQPQKCIELGTLFGYSAIHIARGLPPGGKLVSVEQDPDMARVARENICAAGVDDRVEIVIADAAEYLKTIPNKSIDLVFIDADKKNYPKYLKLSYPLLREGGLLIADDAFGSGDFSDETGGGIAEIEAHRAIDTYNRAVMRSERLFSCMLGTKNGLMVSLRLRNEV